MLDRRSFLNHSAVIAAATAALRGTPLLADEPKKPRGRLPGETLRVCVVGVHGCEITHVCDVDPKVIGQAMDKVGKKRGKDPTFVQDIRRALDDKSIDVVSIATPNHW